MPSNSAVDSTEIHKPARKIIRTSAWTAAFVFSWMSLALMTAFLVLAAVVWTYSRDLPSYELLASYEPPTISRIFSGEGRLIDEFARERRLFSPIEEIPDLVKQAFVSAEDKSFFSHKGYDPTGILKAGAQALLGGQLRGASTITQQVMKNFLLSSERSVERKIREIVLAARIEKSLSKDQILELYLNEIFLGQNSFGVTAAAQTYFNKPLEALSIEEAAYLAALPKAPSTYHPLRQKERAISRRNFVIREMVENGFVEPEDGVAAMDRELRTVLNGDYVGYTAHLPPRGYFTDEIRRQLSGTFGEDEFFGGGLTIRATVDPELQVVATHALRAGLEHYDRQRGVWKGTGVRLSSDQIASEEGWRATLSELSLPRDIAGWHLAVVLELRDGSAIIGVEDSISENQEIIPASDVQWARMPAGNDSSGSKARSASDLLTLGDVVFVTPVMSNGEVVHWSLRQLPEVQGAFMAMDTNSGRVLAMQGGFSYQHSVFNRATQAMRQPGSAFKPFVYAAALDSGYTPATIVIDAPIEFETPEGLWRPSNSSNRYYGPILLRMGIEQSRNLMTVRLANDVGLNNIAKYAENFGVYDSMNQLLSNSLGTQETTLFKMVAAYAMFSNGGERVEPTLVDRVQNRHGITVYRHDQRFCVDCGQFLLLAGEVPNVIADRQRVIDAVTSYQLTLMLEGVVERGTARNTVNPGFPVAGKTGTTNESRDAWFIGFTPNIVAGCYIGFDLPKSLGKRAYGGTLCGPIFDEFIKKASKKYGTSDFKVPEGGVFVNIDRFTGERVPQLADEDRVLSEFFREGTEPSPGEFRIIDGGFVMASDLPVFDPDEESGLESSDIADLQIGESPIAKGDDADERGSFGSLSSGGLY